MRQRLAVEPLEDRRLLALLNLVPTFSSPLITYDATGVVQYNAVAQSFDVDATPLTFSASIVPPSPTRLIVPPNADFQIHIKVDNAGSLIGGAPGLNNDLVITGNIDLDGNGSIDASGTLLTGEVLDFGFLEAGAVDKYDVRFKVGTVGALTSFYAGNDIYVTMTSEHSSFSNSFASNFTGGAKGNVFGTEPDEVPLPDRAKIEIDADSTNRVGESHTFIVTVMEDPGTGTFVPAAGETVMATLTGVGGITGGTCVLPGTTDANGQCTVIVNSAVAGAAFIHATSNVAVGSSVIPVATVAHDGVSSNDDAQKTWVDARIKITPDETNEVGQPHTFDVLVLEDTGDGIDSDGDGSTFDPAAGETVTVTLTNANGALAVPPGPFVVVTDANGMASVTFASATAGTVTGHASSSVSVGGLSLARQTNGTAGNSPDAVKTYVDARIKITPDETNEVGQPHTFDVLVLEDNGDGIDSDGDGSTFDPAAGETVTVTLTNANGALAVPAGPFVVVTDAMGLASVTFASATAGTVTGHASSSVSVGGLSLARQTNGTAGNSPDAVKTYVDARIKITPDATNRVGQPHTFDVLVLEDTGDGIDSDGDGSTFDPAADETVTVTLTNAGGANATPAGPFVVVTNASGMASVTFVSATAGTVTGHASSNVMVGGLSLPRETNGLAGNSPDAVKIYINPGIKIEKFTNGNAAQNEGDPDVPEIAPGQTVTWTYKVTNTGSVPYDADEVVIVDDAGTPGVPGDDFSTTSGGITLVTITDTGIIGVLSPGETWTYTASGIAQDLPGSGVGSAVTFDFSGNSALDGTDGNTRSYTMGGISVRASAFSRVKGAETPTSWSTAFLGAFGGGLGVTDSSEGDGSGNGHTVDNMGRDNYVLFEFNQEVAIDSAFLGYVVNDSDLKIWIGNISGAFTGAPPMLSDAVLSGLGFSELNETTLTTTRLADLNSGNISGNVLVIAANPEDTSPEDHFKIEKATVRTVEHVCYENYAVVTVTPFPDITDDDVSHYCNPPAPPANPGIDIEKFTNGVDAATPAQAPAIAPGATVTWTYHVMNTGNVPFAFADVDVTDDNGTPGTASDDFTPTLVGSSDTGVIGVLSPGETWIYQATGTAQNLTAPSGPTSTFNFAGSSATDGGDGNTRTFTAGGVSVKASGSSRDKTTGDWSPAYLGSYGGGLGVTDSSEGDGSNNTHTVDNVGRDNYVLFEFSESVVIDSAFLGYVVNDSDLSIWIGTTTDPFNNHVTLSDMVLNGLAFEEVNLTDLATTRTADFNGGNVSGNVLVIAAWTDDDTPEDRFKIEKLAFKKTQAGIYVNKGTVQVPGDSDHDLSHYKNPAAPPPPSTGSISGRKYIDVTGNGLTYVDDTPVNGWTIKLYKDDGDGVRDGGDTLAASTMTAGTGSATGSYSFTGLAPGRYFVEEVVTSDYVRTKPNSSNYYKVDIDGNSATGKDFANFKKCDPCSVTSISYSIKRGGSTFTVNDLSGNTNEGDIVTVNFTVPSGPAVPVSFVTYTAPQGTFDADLAYLQQVFDAQTGFFLPGTHSMTVKIPAGYYQIDLVCGPIIHKFGPAGSNSFYTPQGRLIDADGDGDNVPPVIGLQSHTLIVGGGSGSDNIQFNLASDPDKLSVVINGTEVGKVSHTSDAGLKITRLAANGNYGDDTIKVSQSISIPAILRGGSGWDTLTGGTGNDMLFGEGGDDKLYGYLGRDLLVGGEDKDKIYGSANDDILIGGYTVYDNNLTALDAIMKEWGRTDIGYTDRVNHLTGAVTSGAWNGSYKLIANGTSKTVEDDEDQDSLWGEDGMDWFFVNTDGDNGTLNDIVNYVAGEVRTDID